MLNRRWGNIRTPNPSECDTSIGSDNKKAQQCDEIERNGTLQRSRSHSISSCHDEDDFIAE